MPISFHPNI